MTSYSKIYDAFLAKILEDEWAGWNPANIEDDLKQILDSAIPYFKFPRKNLLDRTDVEFNEDLDNEEIQILASYMKVEWLNRSLMTWENIRPMYDEVDFSPANLMDKMRKMLAQEISKAANLEARYYRSRKGKPFDFTKMAGKQ